MSNDTLASIETASLTGGAGNNTFDASAFSPAGALGVTLAGLLGSDTMTGSPQDDLLKSVDGIIDANNCGPGNDTVNADDIDANAADCETVAVADTTPPQTSITSGPGNGATITTSTATFGFSSDEAGSAFTCSLDGGPAEACNAGVKAYSGLANGSHTFAVFATDAAGNADASPATRSFNVQLPVADRTAPALKLAGAKKQKSKSKIVVKATCADEACDLKATGKIKVKILKGKKVKKHQDPEAEERERLREGRREREAEAEAQRQGQEARQEGAEEEGLEGDDRGHRDRRRRQRVDRRAHGQGHQEEEEVTFRPRGEARL